MSRKSKRKPRRLAELLRNPTFRGAIAALSLTLAAAKWFWPDIRNLATSGLEPAPVYVPATTAYARRPSVYILPSVLEVSAGDLFTVVVQIDTLGYSVDSAQVYIRYDSKYLQVREITGSEVLGSEILNSWDNARGLAGYAAANFVAYANEPFPLCTVEFEAVSITAAAKLHLSTDPPFVTKVGPSPGADAIIRIR